MSLFTIVIVLVFVGLILMAINRWIPMEQNIKTILNWVVIGFVVIWILQGIGAFAYLRQIKI